MLVQTLFFRQLPGIPADNSSVANRRHLRAEGNLMTELLNIGVLMTAFALWCVLGLSVELRQRGP